jgi:hypothetical protein
MKRFAGVLAVAVATGTMFVSAAGPVQAAPGAKPPATTAPEIQWTGPVAVSRDDDTVVVQGRYRCTAPLEEMHLWVSVKQGGPDPTAPGSSSTVDAWYDTNISQDVGVTCDGRWQTTRVDLGRWDTDFTGRPLGTLANGTAWLQFCLVQGTDEETAIVASESRWVRVVAVR